MFISYFKTVQIVVVWCFSLWIFFNGKSLWH